MEATASYLLVLQIYQFKAKDNISKYFAVDNIKKTKLKGIVFFFLLLLIILIIHTF